MRNAKFSLCIDKASSRYFLLAFLLYASPVFGQNLISDPSFEEMRCTEIAMDFSSSWFVNEKIQSVIVSGCCEPTSRPNSPNIRKTVKFGDKMASMTVISSQKNPRFNYVAPVNILKDTLEGNFNYYCSFFVSLSGKNALAIKEIGVNFINYFPDTTTELPNQPFFGSHDLENEEKLLDDTVGWEKVSGNYLANGLEHIVVFGYMRPEHDATTKKLKEADFLYSQYFIDGFSLIPYPELPADTVLCAGTTLQLSPRVPEGAFYEWSTGQQGGSLSITQPGTYWVRNYTEFDTIYDSIRVDYIPQKPQEPNITACGPSEYLLDLSANYPESLRWFDGVLGTQRRFSQSGTYPFSIAISGCELFDTFRLTLVPSPNILLPSLVQVCETQPEWLSIKGLAYDSVAWNGLWQDSFAISSSEKVRSTLAIEGCLFSDSTTVQVWPDIRYGPIDTAICPQGLLNLRFDTLQVQYQAAQELSIRDTGTYYLRYANGCDTQNLVVRVKQWKDCECQVFLPNAFSPDGNGINDTFRLFSTCAIESQVFRIYNRWGQQVYESTESAAWNGWFRDRFTEGHRFFYTWSAVLTKHGGQQKLYKSGLLHVVD